MSHLSDRLNELNKNNYSTRKISELAQKAGHNLNYSTVSRYLKGDHPEPPKLTTLMAFAAAFGIDLNELEQAANMPTSREPFILPPSANTLNKKERDVILRMIEVLTENKTVESFHPERSDIALAADETNTSHQRRREYFDALGEESQEMGEE